MGKQQAEVGPEPPKRPQSGYGQFFAKKRQDIFATLKEKGVAPAKIMTSSSKQAGEMWKALGEEGQARYNQKAEKLKVAYTEEMKAFKAAHPDFKKVKKVKKVKGEAKPPTRPGGAYQIWLADNRLMLTETVMKKHSVDRSKAFLMLYKEGKTLYDALPAAEKKKFEEKAEAAKMKFQVEFKEWKENHKENSKGGFFHQFADGLQNGIVVNADLLEKLLQAQESKEFKKVEKLCNTMAAAAAVAAEAEEEARAEAKRSNKAARKAAREVEELAEAKNAAAVPAEAEEEALAEAKRSKKAARKAAREAEELAEAKKERKAARKVKRSELETSVVREDVEG